VSGESLVEVYDIEKGRWEQLPQLPDPYYESRYFTDSVHTEDDFFVYFEMYDNTVNKEIKAFNFSTKQWRNIDPVPQTSSMSHKSPDRQDAAFDDLILIFSDDGALTYSKEGWKDQDLKRIKVDQPCLCRRNTIKITYSSARMDQQGYNHENQEQASQQTAAPSVEFLVDPVFVKCPNCGEQVQTKTESSFFLIGCLFGFLCIWTKSESSFSLIGCLFGFLCICACCCIPHLRSIKHTCPECNAVLGRYNGQFWKTC